MGTLAEFWIEQNGAVWRTARRKESRCGECEGPIRIGESYLDTLEQTGGPFQFLKICRRCANQPTEETDKCE